ncbi:restriction endonuclease subunit S [Thiocapsa sp.]|uniref:restriction endonuclease subunit S n=1 Tax=Thiocapsa sp. TaxID=2024551 RepID=UPI002C41AB2D|nr:restriction endonuclease subunit S [Thiocapsa sp.]HSO82225.1 restriction endonuclease subunit S [Thiocapsa sp.]
MSGDPAFASTRRLGDIAEVIPGFAFKSKDWCGSGIPVLKIKNIVGDGSIDAGEVDCVPESLMNERLRRVLVRDGDILVAMTGATAGKVGRLRSAGQFLLNQRVAKLIPKSINPLFFWSVVSSSEYQHRFFRLADGSAQPNMSGSQLEGVEVPYPPISTQEKIAAILSVYDGLIENNTRRIKILEEMAQSLYREWFVKFRFPGYRHARFHDSPLGPVPEGWHVSRLDQLVNFQNEGAKAGDHLRERIYLPIECILKKSLAVEEVRSWREAQSSLHLFEVGDIVFGAMRPYFHKITVAPFKGVTRKTCFVLRSREPAYHAFSVLTLFQESTVSFANAHSKGATIPYAVWPQAMDGLLIAMPPANLAKEYEDVVGPMISEIGNTYFRNRNLRRTRDLLLPKLISGELDVSELDIAVPEDTA